MNAIREGMVASTPSSATARRGYADGWRSHTDAGTLEDILGPELDLVVWQRTLPEALADSLQTWARVHPAEFDDIVHRGSRWSSKAFRGLDGPSREWVQRDVEMLVDRFRRLTESDRVRISFGAVRDDRCRKFHIDRLRYRLVTTYSGPGTQWLARGARRPAPDSHRDADIHHAAPGDVIVMKGELEDGGLLHRSPPLGGTGEARVVLIVSTVEKRAFWQIE